MNAVNPPPRFNIEDFLAWEAEQAERHEYLHGEVFAMTGAQDAHNTISGNVFAALKAALRGSPCRTFIADMKLRIDAADAAFYPDIMVTCDPRDRAPEAATAKRQPVLIVEVLSESTAAYDRGLKFEQYRMIDTLREYLLVEQDRRHVDLFRRDADGRWLLIAGDSQADVVLESVGQTLSVATVYEDVEFAGTAGPA